jgi:hypothetical protein
MRWARGSTVASAAFGIVVVFAVGALAWGAMHNGAAKHGLGTARQQAAARNTLLTGVPLPSGLAFDRTLTACGGPSDACLTGSADVASTLASMRSVLRTAGGSLEQVCGAAALGPNPNAASTAASPPRFTCAVAGRLNGASLVVLLGDGWVLPGHPAPRTAVLIDVESSPGAAPVVVHAVLPSTSPSAGSLLPAGWAAAPEPCGPASTAASAVPGQSVLPPCSPHSTTFVVSAPVAAAVAGGQLAATAGAQGFRLDGRPCVVDPAFVGCQVWAERMTGTTPSTRVQRVLVASLRNDGQGYTTGTVTITDQS